jgi:hypothetical protein
MTESRTASPTSSSHWSGVWEGVGRGVRPLFLSRPSGWGTDVPFLVEIHVVLEELGRTGAMPSIRDSKVESPCRGRAEEVSEHGVAIVISSRPCDKPVVSKAPDVVEDTAVFPTPAVEARIEAFRSGVWVRGGKVGADGFDPPIEGRPSSKSVDGGPESPSRPDGVIISPELLQPGPVLLSEVIGV